MRLSIGFGRVVEDEKLVKWNREGLVGELTAYILEAYLMTVVW